MQLLRTGKVNETASFVTVSPLEVRWTPSGAIDISLWVADDIGKLIQARWLPEESYKAEKWVDEHYDEFAVETTRVSFTGEWKIWYNKDTRNQRNYIKFTEIRRVVTEDA